MKIFKWEVDLHNSAIVVTHLYFGIFVLFSLIAFGRMVHLFMRSKKGWDIKKIVHCMIPVGLLLRAGWFAILLEGYYTDGIVLLIDTPKKQSAFSIIVGSLPGYWSISDYLLVWLFWLYLSHDSAYYQTARVVTKIKISYLILNGIMYAIWLTLMILIFWCSCSKLAHIIEAGIAVGLNLLMALMFAIVGPRTFVIMKRTIAYQNSPKERLLMQRVGILSVVCCFAFFFRGTVLGLGYFMFTGKIATFVATSIYLVVLEMGPELAILFVIGKRSKQKNEKDETSPLMENQKDVIPA